LNESCHAMNMRVRAWLCHRERQQKQRPENAAR
jgi:hypothetical protein